MANFFEKKLGRTPMYTSCVGNKNRPLMMLIQSIADALLRS